MECKNELGNSTARDDGPIEPFTPRELHAAATPYQQRTPRRWLSRMDAILPGSLLPRNDALSKPQHGQSGEWRRYFTNLRMGNPFWKSPKEGRTTFRTNGNLLWIILVLICSVTWPQAHGLTVEVEEFVRATAGGQTTISCNYTDDKPGSSGTNKNGMSAPLDVRWMRTFSNGSSEILLTKTGSTIKGKWSEEERATVVGQASLKIYAVSFRDDGKYTCKVGDVQGTTELLVDENPRILNVHSELVINAKEAFELTCKGADELNWEWPTHPQQSFTISSRRDTFSSGQMSILRIEQVSTEDTGEYQCVHSHPDSQDKWYSAPVYVFVTSTEEPLFLAPAQTNIVHFWDEPFIIPCRVSSPDATVSLFPMENATSDGLTSALVATYDPRVGFTVDAKLTDYSGNISCKAVLGDRTEVQSYMAEFVGRPKIITDTPEVVINRTSELELTCEGVQPMQWLTPDGVEGRLETVETLSKSPNSDPMYRSVLTLYDAQWLDTGEYSCQYKRYAAYDDPPLTSSVYVFVRSPDSKELFLPAADDVYIKNDSRPFIVPCRVSDPSVADSVTLTIVYTVSSESVAGLTWMDVYDPKVGFTVSLNLGNETRKLTVLCTVDQRFTSFHLYQEGKTQGESLFQTQIVPSARQLVQGTGPLKITCRVEIPFLAYNGWNYNAYPQFEFFFPNQQNEEKGNVEISTTGFTVEKLILIFTKDLTIHKVSLENSGLFYCNIHNEETNLTINESVSVIGSGYMSLSHHPVDRDTIEAIEGEAEVCPQILMEAFPSATFQWSKDGINLTNETHPEFSVMSLPHGENVQIISVCLQNLSLADGGFYTITAVNGYESRNLSVQVIILESPEVNLTISPEPTFQDPPLFYTQQDNRVTCHVWGNPLPQVAWYWRACPNDFCTEVGPLVDDYGWVPIEELGWSSMMVDHLMFPNRKIESVLTIRDPGQAGILKCLATSPSDRIHEPGSEVLVYRPSDLRTILPAAQQVKTVYTDDQITVTCKANIFAFLDDLVWDWAPTANESEPVEIAGDDDRIKATEMTGYHYQSGLSIEGALRNNSGVYRCHARQRSNGERQVVHVVQLNVKDIIPPTITAGLLPYYDLDRKNRLPIKFKLECQASGDPIPSLAWYKDGKPITVRNATVSDIQTFSQENFTVVSQLFLVPHISEAHGGNYLCLVSNSGGEVGSNGRIHIGESPTAVIEEDVVTRKVGENLTVVCQTTGEPAPTIAWMKEEETGEQKEVPSVMYENRKKALTFKELQRADNGKYFCVASNIYGETTAEVTVILLSGDVFLLPLLVGGISVGAIILILILCLLATFKRMRLLARKAKRNSQQDVEMFPVNPRSPRTPMSPFRMSFREEFADHLPFDPRWEFPRDRLKLGSLIGQGAFGMVLKGVAAGINQNERYVPVAVKTVKSDSSYIDRKALLGELKMLIQVGHHLNVVNFLGACTQETSPLVIVEFCPYGNLCDYLRSKRDNFQKTPQKSEQEENEANELNYADLVLKEACVSEPAAVEYELVDKEAKRVAEKALMVEDLVCYCFQVARGMEFLASRKCIHRDLAARNVLLAENNVVKICDFGLSRSIYHDADYIGSGKGLLPIKWMAPEAIFDKVFTTYSDIWSFGVFTWEVFSMGGSPYPGVQVDEKFYDKMKAGYRMSCPEHAPQDVYDLMHECWRDEPKDRPMFSELAEQLGNQLESNTRQEYIDLNIPYSEGMYCELDFAKPAAKEKPDTVTEEPDTVQPTSDNPTDTEEDGNVRYQMSPTLKKESRPSTPTPPCQDPKQDQCAKSDLTDDAFPTDRYAAFHPAGDNAQQGPPVADRVQLPETLPDDPYHRGTEPTHSYSSLRQSQPRMNSYENEETNSSEISNTPEEGKLHTYASIKGTRPSPDDTNKAGFERNHLYSSIKGSRPGLTPNTTSEIKNDIPDPTEGSSLLRKPRLPERNFQSSSLDGLSADRVRPTKPLLPKRDLSTTSWSPETETLLTRSESPELDAPAQPVYV